MPKPRKGFYILKTLVALTVIGLTVGFFILAIYKAKEITISAQKESQAQHLSPEVFQQRQEAARQRAEERQAQEEIDRQTQIALEKENSVYEITCIQIDRELDFYLYTLRHRINNTEYLLVVTPKGSSITPLHNPE